MWTDEEINNIVFVALQRAHTNHGFEGYTRETYDQDTVDIPEDHQVMIDIIREILNVVAPKE